MLTHQSGTRFLCEAQVQNYNKWSRNTKIESWIETQIHVQFVSSVSAVKLSSGSTAACEAAHATASTAAPAAAQIIQNEKHPLWLFLSKNESPNESYRRLRLE